ncbi:DgyrCDS13043 [Dimorphilus gyrociliatus]|uniref:DgyrCDS13043 n=1 Tax=Dimorphilus gyrociliatus TaxID=2664684 RepID=A0A7I8W9H3_9ANNE|nr:DgyrCDS13043 [Dimorphilus gyrociliatus]
MASEQSTNQGDDREASLFELMGFPDNMKLRIANEEWATIYPDNIYKDQPFPLKVKKTDVLKDCCFDVIDNIAVSTTDKDILEKSEENLVKYLTKVCFDELKKVRILFRWLSSLKLPELSLDNKIEKSVSYYLNQLYREETDYSTVFQRLCSLANLKCFICEGRIRTDTDSNRKNDDKYIKSRWNVVRIKDNWYLCNPQFACSHGVKYDKAWCLINDDGTLEEMEEKFDEKAEYKTYYNYNDYYFLTNPEELIYTHLPDNPKFQLLARKVTFNEFEEMVCLRQPFFDAGLTIISHPKRIIETSDPKLEIFIGTNSDIPVSFRHQICLLNDSNSGENSTIKAEPNVDLQSYVTLFQDRLRFRVVIRLRLPKSGIYKLAIFLRNEKDEILQRSVYKSACDYELHYTRKTDDVNIHSFPITAKTELGPNSDMEKFNFSNISPTIGMIDTDEDGYAEINFDGDDKIFNIFSKLENQQIGLEDLKNSLLSTFENGRASIRVFAPQEGEYALNIYAKKRDEIDKEMDPVCSYIINCKTKPKRNIKFPHEFNRKIGIQEKFIEFGLRTESDFQSFQKLNKKSTQFKIYKSKACKFNLELLHWDLYGAENIINNCAYCKNEMDYSTISIKFPSPGIYKLTVFVDQVPDGSQLLPVYICYFLVLDEKEVKKKEDESSNNYDNNEKNSPRNREEDWESKMDEILGVTDFMEMNEVDGVFREGEKVGFTNNKVSLVEKKTTEKKPNLKDSCRKNTADKSKSTLNRLQTASPVRIN